MPLQPWRSRFSGASFHERLYRSDPEKLREYLEDLLYRVAGNLRAAAFHEGCDRSIVCRWLERLGMMHRVNEIRREMRRPAWLTKARRALTMDEQIAAIVEATAGKSVDEIQAMIEASANAGEVPDPGLLAAYIAHLGGGAA